MLRKRQRRQEASRRPMRAGIYGEIADVILCMSAKLNASSEANIIMSMVASYRTMRQLPAAGD